MQHQLLVYLIPKFRQFTLLAINFVVKFYFKVICQERVVIIFCYGPILRQVDSLTIQFQPKHYFFRINLSKRPCYKVAHILPNHSFIFDLASISNQLHYRCLSRLTLDTSTTRNIFFEFFGRFITPKTLYLHVV